MRFFNWFQKTEYLSDAQKLAFYPPFFFMGVQISHVSEDYRTLRVKLPLRWYARNHHSTMFGGFMSSLADPLPALLCHKIFPHTDVWTKKLTIHFLRPGRSDLELRLEITEEDVATIRKDLENTGKSRPKFKFYYFDDSNQKVAVIENTVAMQCRKHRKAAK